MEPNVWSAAMELAYYQILPKRNVPAIHLTITLSLSAKFHRHASVLKCLSVTHPARTWDGTAIAVFTIAI